MQKETKLWEIEELQKKFKQINFPEYQREPNIWSRAEKQRLIDSIMREFDIASIYLYEYEDGSVDCIDGRQRLGSIMAFLNDNPEDDDEGFEYKPMNEIYEDEDEDMPFEELDGMDYEEIEQEARGGDTTAENFLKKFLSYKFSVVKLTDSSRPEEFNLQFTRLNLGMIINSGEKLNAMVGDLRDVCFHRLSEHPFLEEIGIPTRRFAKEQLSAQILAQVFSIAETGEYTRTRHVDLQSLFKKHTSLSQEHQRYVDRVEEILHLLDDELDNQSILGNRALTVSAVLMAWKLEIESNDKASDLAAFLEEFLCRLDWQLDKGLDFNDEFRDLVDFNRDVTQASVEQYAVRRRTEKMMDYYEHWTDTGEIIGDEEYDGNPEEECQEAVR